MSEITHADGSVALMKYTSGSKTWAPVSVAKQVVHSTALTIATDPPTKAECEAIIARVDEIRLALHNLGLTSTS